MIQSEYSESELKGVIGFNEKMNAYSSPKLENLLIDDEGAEDYFQDPGSDYDDIIINYSPLKDLSPPRSPSLFNVPLTETREFGIVSGDIE